MTITKEILINELAEAGIEIRDGRYVRRSDVLHFIKGEGVVPRQNADVIPSAEKRETLSMFYQALLTAMGREGDIPVFERAIKMIPDREVEQEFKAVMDGTVSKIVKTMMRDDLSDDEKAEMGAIWEGLGRAYIQDYKGDVPEDDLAWAHDQISDFFTKVENDRIQLPAPTKRLKG